MMEVMIALLHLGVIVAMTYLLSKRSTDFRPFMSAALALKLFAGICLGLMYLHYFPGGDTFVYFDDAAKLAALAWKDPSSYFNILFFTRGVESASLALLEPRALFFTKLTSVVSLITGNNYWAISFYFSFVSFLAACHLVGVIRRNLPSCATAAVVAFLFMPSVVFWTSGVLKESLAMAAFFFLAALFLKIWFHNRMLLWEWALSVLAVWVFWNLKYYYAGAFIAIAVASLLYKRTLSGRTAHSAGVEAIGWVMFLLVPAILVTFLHPNFYLDRLPDVIVSNNAVYNEMSDPGEYVVFYHLSPTAWSILINTPWALFSGLFRPLAWEASSLVQLAQAMENTLLLLLFCISIMGWGRYARSRHRLLILAVVTFVLGTCAFVTLSAPNFGTLSRYRVGYIPFFTFIVLCHNPVLSYFERSLRLLSGIRGKS